MSKSKDVKLLRKIKRGERLNSKDLNSNPEFEGKALESLTETIKLSILDKIFKK